LVRPLYRCHVPAAAAAEDRSLNYNTRVPGWLLATVFLLILAFFGWLMISRRMTATIALPLAAVSLAVVALIPLALEQGASAALQVMAAEVIEPGIARLSGAIFAVILGAVLAAQIKISGAAERIVRYAAEYAGEDRFRLGLLLLVVIAILFTTLGGLGAVILVASITLPLLFSLGFEPKVAGVLFLLGLSLGGCLNPVNWALYKSVLLLTTDQIIPFAVLLAALFFMVSCAYLLLAVGAGAWRRNVGVLAALLAVAAAIWLLVTQAPAAWTMVKHVTAAVLLAILTALAAGLLWRLFSLAAGLRAGWLKQTDNWMAGASVLVPLLLLLWSSLHANLAGGQAKYAVPILTALACGIAFCALASLTRDGAGGNRLMKALFDGVAAGGPAIVLLIGVGLLLLATNLPAVVGSFQPIMENLPVGSAFGFVLVFFLLSPLALYRGPLNLYGMGSGVVGIIAGSAIIPGSLIMVAFFSVGMLQGVCDPTNTHNVWIANYCKVPVNDLTRLSFTWVLAIVFLGLLAGALMFAGGFALPQ